MNTEDRGTKKWTSLMLPEHVEALQSVFAETIEKPVLDEQQKVEMDMLLQLALKDNLTVEINYYTNDDYHSVSGKPVTIDALTCRLKLQAAEIALDDVIGVRIL